MRAEYARAAALALPSRAFPIRRRLIRQVAQRLEVEVVARTELREAGLRHGRPIPPELLPR
jgi:hypothetical protein